MIYSSQTAGVSISLTRILVSGTWSGAVLRLQRRTCDKTFKIRGSPSVMVNFRRTWIPLCLLSFGFLLYYLGRTDKISELLKFSNTVAVPRDASKISSKTKGGPEIGHSSAISAFPNVIVPATVPGPTKDYEKPKTAPPGPGKEEEEEEEESGATESKKVPIRGPGDSQLPFQAKFAAQAYGSKDFGLGYGREPFILARCPVNTCFTTGDRNRFKPEELDAVLWHFRANDRSLPSVRSPHTRYVFWVMESASYLYGNIDKYRHVFNWTFTYRLDSDFPNAYDVVYRLRTPVAQKDYRNITSGKTKLAAWFVTNCYTSSKREKFVQELKKFISVDIYGGCGSLKCPRSSQWDTCYKNLEKEYKFYFSFENSFCQDYVTEKFFNILRFYVVPVVYGFGNYFALAPPHSYINALDFPSAEALANYLLYLDKNDTAYNEYFRWKPYHHFPTNWDKRMNHWCELCRRLHTDNEPKTYHLLDWFVKKSHCRGSFEEARAFLHKGK
ncbi:alpha-(1,3)-fucosyltransferase C-like isoform X1 [Macrobrachium rosenbergii]|uniref:alpha-(1,3)-fucosyltransferase C-like isoform X1 n=1 Tax=Macrobrachium rosenbergii TaxID=79674 RepID=UPI0034D5E8EF